MVRLKSRMGQMRYTAGKGVAMRRVPRSDQPMADFSLPFSDPGLDERIRLRTLVTLRWIAVVGQTATLVIASFVLSLRIELGLGFLAVGAAVVANLMAMSVFPANQRLSDRAAMLTLLFDITQLTFLLFLTGGLNNPFALLFVVPVTVSATALSLRATLILGSLSIAMISLLAVAHVPLRTQEGFVLAMPEIYLAGFWAAITVGTVFMAAYAHRLTRERNSMAQALFATQTALSREQKLTDLGGVVAAYAHEMGTPLATITLVSSELADELDGAEDPALKEDALLIRQEADRCRDILRSMGRAGKDDTLMRQAPLGAVIKEAAEPHSERGIEILYSFGPMEHLEPSALRQPEIWRKPELIHGLRNMVQNAVDFAKARVWIDGHWSEDRVQIRITDDGDGYPPELIGRIGDPFLRRRKSARNAPQREGYEGMGLGLFIAKTLLERTGAKVSFANGADPFLHVHERPERSGAIVDLQWNSGDLIVPVDQSNGGLGDNPLNLS